MLPYPTCNIFSHAKLLASLEVNLSDETSESAVTTLPSGCSSFKTEPLCRQSWAWWNGDRCSCWSVGGSLSLFLSRYHVYVCLFRSSIGLVRIGADGSFEYIAAVDDLCLSYGCGSLVVTIVWPFCRCSCCCVKAVFGAYLGAVESIHLLPQYFLSHQAGVFRARCKRARAEEGLHVVAESEQLSGGTQKYRVASGRYVLPET